MTKFILFFLFPLSLFAQEPDWPKSYLSAGYYGNLVTNPGISFDYHLTLAESIKTINKTKRSRSAVKYKTRQLELTPQIGIYFDPQSHKGAFYTLSVGYRKIGNRGLFFNPSVGIGAYTLITRNNYSFNGNSTFFEGTTASTFTSATAKLGIGRMKTSKKKGFYLNFSTLLPFNYNTGVTPLPAIEIGRIF